MPASRNTNVYDDSPRPARLHIAIYDVDGVSGQKSLIGSPLWLIYSIWPLL
jgi:hypothetical protein